MRLRLPGKSLEEHKMDGTWRNTRHGDSKAKDLVVENKGVLLTPKPSHFNAREGEIWDTIIAYKASMGSFQLSDLEAVVGYIDALTDYERIRKLLKDDDFTMVDKEGEPKKHPLLGALFTADSRRLKWLQELGLTPLARMKLKMMELRPEEEENTFDGFDDDDSA